MNLGKRQTKKKKKNVKRLHHSHPYGHRNYIIASQTHISTVYIFGKPSNALVSLPI